MAGRPKRDIAVEVVFLRLPKDLVERVTRCAGILQTREGVKLNTTQAYTRLLEIACDAVEHQQTPLAPLAVSETSKLAEIASIANGAPTDYDDMLACLGEEDDEETPVLPVDVPQVAETPEPAPASPVNGTMTPAPSAKRPASHALPPETLQAIADERTHCEGLSYREFAQRLHEKGIYSATAKDGSKVPPNKGNVTKWLKQARAAGMY
jgi:hypothetical protein